MYLYINTYLYNNAEKDNEEFFVNLEKSLGI